MANNFKEMIDKHWPSARAELNKAMKVTGDLLVKGEKAAVDLSKKGIAATKKISLGLLRDKHYYDLGKLVAGLNREKWAVNARIESLIKEIKKIGQDIKNVKE